MRRERLHIRPVVRELLLELRDRLLPLLRSRPRSAPARSAAAASASGGRLRLRLRGLRLDRAPEGRRARRAAGRNRPSRRRTSAACRLRSPAYARPRRPASARSCETSRTVPGKASSAASSASRLSRSRWFVGSSRTRKFAPDATTSASARRRRSPPESTATAFCCSSQPEKRKRPRRFCASGRRSPVAPWAHSSTDAALVELHLLLGEVRDLDAVAEARPAAVVLAPAEHRLEQRRLARAVRADERDVLAALEREGRVAVAGVPAETPRSSASTHRRPLRGGLRNSKPSAPPLARQQLRSRPAPSPAPSRGARYASSWPAPCVAIFG